MEMGIWLDREMGEWMTVKVFNPGWVSWAFAFSDDI